MPQLSPPKIPLPGVVSIFIFWLLFLSICATLVFIFVITNGAFSFPFAVVMLIMLFVATAPIGDFLNRSPRAILSSKIASAFFSLLTCIASFSIVGIAGKTIDMPEDIGTHILYSPHLIWLTAMGLMFTSALLLSFFFYVQYSGELKKCLRITEISQKNLSLPFGSLGTLSLITVVLSLRFILGLAFFSEEKESEALLFALIVALPHLFMALSLLACFIKKISTPSLYYTLGCWILILLIMMASRNYILGEYSSMLPMHLIPIFSIFLYVLPNALIVALPLLWWALSKEKTESTLEYTPSSTFIEQLLELPLPLTIALLYVGFQGVFFAFNAVNPQLISINGFSSELQNTALDFSGMGKQNGTFFFAIGMLPLSFLCIFMTLKNPYQGIGLCRVFCLLSVLLHGISILSILSLGFSAIHFSDVFISEATFYCFTSIAAYAGFSVIHTILLLPHEEKEKESIQTEPMHAEESIARYEEEREPAILKETSFAGDAEVKEVQEPATPYLDRARPLLAKWLTFFLPSKKQPLPTFLFIYFCFAIMAKWSASALLQSCMLFFSVEKNAPHLAQTFFFFSLLGASFPLMGAYFMQKRVRAKLFTAFLSLWIMSILLMGNYAIVPGFSLLTPESIGIIAMIWYSNNSSLFQKWLQKDHTL